MICRRKGSSPGHTGICCPLLLSRVGPTEGQLRGRLVGLNCSSWPPVGPDRVRSVRTEFNLRGEVTPDDVT